MLTEQLVKFYTSRMQIEEAFRDLKCTRFDSRWVVPRHARRPSALAS